MGRSPLVKDIDMRIVRPGSWYTTFRSRHSRCLLHGKMLLERDGDVVTGTLILQSTTLMSRLAVCVVVCGLAASSGRAAPAQPVISAEERALIEGKVREHLKLPAGAALGAAEFAKVTERYWAASPMRALFSRELQSEF